MHNLTCSITACRHKTLLLAHLDEASGRQGVHEGMAPGILLQHVRDEPHRSGVHLLQPDTDRRQGSHKRTPSILPTLHDSASKTMFVKVLFPAPLPVLPDHVEVRWVLDVQLEKRGDVLRRLRCGHVPGHNLQPEKQTDSIILHVSRFFLFVFFFFK